MVMYFINKNYLGKEKAGDTWGQILKNVVKEGQSVAKVLKEILCNCKMLKFVLYISKYTLQGSICLDISKEIKPWKLRYGK